MFARLVMALGVVISASVFGISAAWAQELGAQELGAQNFGVSEIRGGVMAHSVDEHTGNSTFGFLNLTRIQDANVELLFTPFEGTEWLGSPRPTIGATLNFGGLESQAYAGLTWHAQLFDTPVFVEGLFGAAVHNGQLHNAVYPARSLGCPVLFHEAASLGYNISDNSDVMLTVEHSSHAGLCGDDNRGLTNLGVRFGFKF